MAGKIDLHVEKGNGGYMNADLFAAVKRVINKRSNNDAKRDENLMVVPSSYYDVLRRGYNIIAGGMNSGRGFLWNALLHNEHRSRIASVFSIPSSNIVVVPCVDVHGVATQGDGLYESMQSDPRQTWRTLVAYRLDVPFMGPLKKLTWAQRVAWVRDNPGDYDRSLWALDSGSTNTMFILFRGLDQFMQWDSPHPQAVVRSLLQTVLDMTSFINIIPKVFMSSSMFENDAGVWCFSDASKLAAGEIRLTWRPEELVALFFTMLIKGPDGNIVESVLTDLPDLPNMSSMDKRNFIQPYIMDAGWQEENFHLVFQRECRKGPNLYKWLIKRIKNRGKNRGRKNDLYVSDLFQCLYELREWRREWRDDGIILGD